MADGPDSVTTALYLKKTTKARLLALAQKESRSMSNVAQMALEIGLKKLEGQKAV